MIVASGISASVAPSAAPWRVDRRVGSVPTCFGFRTGLGRGAGTPNASFHCALRAAISTADFAILASRSLHICLCFSTSSLFAFFRGRASSSSSSPEPDSEWESEDESEELEEESEEEELSSSSSPPANVYLALLNALGEPSTAAELSSGASCITVSYDLPQMKSIRTKRCFQIFSHESLHLLRKAGFVPLWPVLRQGSLVATIGDTSSIRTKPRFFKLRKTYCVVRNSPPNSGMGPPKIIVE
jgi:hypothetical protein